MSNKKKITEQDKKAMCMLIDTKVFTKEEICKQHGIALSTLNRIYREINGNQPRGGKKMPRELKISEEQKAEIYGLSNTGMSDLDIAKTFGIEKSYVRKIYKDYKSALIIKELEEKAKNYDVMKDENEKLKQEVTRLSGLYKTSLDEVEKVGLNITDYQTLYKLNTDQKQEIDRLEKEIEYLKNKINLFKLPVENKIAEYDVPANVRRFSELTVKMTELYAVKNKDYGSAFSNSYKEFGNIISCVRMGDKLNRFKTLTKQQSELKSETLTDTLIDLANYAIMTIMELEA